MQTPVYTGPQQNLSDKRLYWARTILAGLILVGLALLYFVLVLPVANAAIIPSNYRWPFQFITIFYAIDLSVLGIEYIYRLGVRAKPPPPRESPVGKSDVLGMVLRSGFMLILGGQYLTGAMISSPQVFQSAFNLFPSSLVGVSVTIFADSLHTLFAGLIIAFGLAIIVFEITKIALHKSTWSNWLVKARYPQIKALYWLIAIVVIIQGTLGLFLAGTISSIGPFGLVGLNGYGFETWVRHIHGPLGAVTFALFTNHVYYRVRPEFRIK
jgi:hypothetical protein